MWMDVLRLRDWYRTYQGRVVRAVVRAQLSRLLPAPGTHHMLALGYSLPYLKDYAGDRDCVTAMPGKMGVLHWPEESPTRSLLVWEASLPFPDNAFDYILLTHCLEFCGSPEDVMAECWRVLRPEGRILVMVPNRAGAWCRREQSPLGRGHPYSTHELHKLFRHGNFIMTQSFCGLFVPPTVRRWLLETWPTWEKIGQRWRAPMGGLQFMEGRKDVYGMHVVRTAKASTAKKRTRRRPVPAAIGIDCAGCHEN